MVAYDPPICSTKGEKRKTRSKNLTYYNLMRLIKEIHGIPAIIHQMVMDKRTTEGRLAQDIK